MALAWVFWEIAVLAAALRLTRPRESPVETLAVVASLDILLGSGIAGALSFARLNSAASYLVIAVLLLAAALWRGLPGLKLPSRWPLAIAPFLPLALLSFRPIQDVDSLNYLHYLLEWMGNRATPYTFFYGFVPLWELNFLPPLVLARSDLFFGLISLKALIVLVCAWYLAALELGLEPRLAALLTASAAAFRYVWFQHSGVATLKNDTLHAAGIVLMALVLMRIARRQSGSPLLMALGVTFACVKFSGPVLALPALAVFWWLSRPRGRDLAAIAVLGTAFSGHYYLRNLIAHGNPFYPFQMNVAGLRLPGVADISYTSILASIGDPRLWRAFFLPAGGLSPAGLLFPAVLAGTLLTGLWFAVKAALARRRPQASPLLAIFLLAAWMVFFRSLYSGSSLPGDLGFILNDLSSLRYVEGALGLSEMLLASLMAPWFAATLATANLVSRLWILYREIPWDVFPLWAAAGVFALTAAFAALHRRRSAAAALAAILCAAPWITTRNRAHWADWWRELHEPFAELAPASIAVVEDRRGGEKAPHFLFAGRRLQHEVRMVEEAALSTWEPRYVVRMVYPNEPKPDFDAFAARQRARGYESVLSAPYGVVLERLRHAPAPLRFDAWWIGEGGLPKRPQGAGEYVFNGRALRPGAQVSELLEPAEGARMRLLNCCNGRALECVYRRGRWEPEGTLPALPTSAPFATVSSGEARQESLSDEAGPFTRIRATAATNWLMLAGNFGDVAPGEPVTIRASLRCPHPGCKLVWVGAHGIEKPARDVSGWQTLVIPLRRPRPKNDYYAAGYGPSQAGDYFDIRDLELLPGDYPALP